MTKDSRIKITYGSYSIIDVGNKVYFLWNPNPLLSMSREEQVEKNKKNDPDFSELVIHNPCVSIVAG